MKSEIKGEPRNNKVKCQIQKTNLLSNKLPIDADLPRKDSLDCLFSFSNSSLKILSAVLLLRDFLLTVEPFLDNVGLLGDTSTLSRLSLSRLSELPRNDER